MKYWRGYIAAALFAALAVVLMLFSSANSVLVDMVYPYVSRLIQTSLSGWCGGVDFCLWQVLLVLLCAVALASVVLMIVFRWNIVQWLGWVLAGVSFLFMLHIGIYGLNQYAGDLADDVRLNTLVDPETGNRLYLDSELVETTRYLQDVANELALQVPRKADGTLDYPAFEELAEIAIQGFDTLVYEKNFSVFAGAKEPVKKLGWADQYTDNGVTGVHVALTGEAAVNPQIPAVVLPFAMCHEMAHRMCIAIERDANLGAFLACDANSDPVFRYAGYFMALRYCYNALEERNTSMTDTAAAQIQDGMNDQLRFDMNSYQEFFGSKDDPTATDRANAVGDIYLKIRDKEEGVVSYAQVSDLLVSWYVQEIYLPAHKEEDVVFDPEDKTQIDLTTPDVDITPTEGATEADE